MAMAKDADVSVAVAADHDEEFQTEPDGLVISTLDIDIPELASSTA
jgi:hypothetical protein